MLTVIDLNRVPLRSPGISEPLIDGIGEVIAAKGRVLVYLNRRGAWRAFLCRDCGHMMRCPRCDVALAFHTSPKRRLLCHHCSFELAIPHDCPSCHGSRMEGIGEWSQSIEESLTRAFPGVQILRLDSDAKRSQAISPNAVQEAQIVVATELLRDLPIGQFELVVFPLLESDLSIPEFDTEERAYARVKLSMQLAKHALVQTFAPKSPFVHDITDGNFKEFLTRTLAERKTYRYPPYTSLAYIHIKDKNRERATDMVAKLKNKLDIIAREINYEGDIFWDREIFTKRADEWIGKIVIKWKKTDELLEHIRKEIIRNRNVRLERRG